MKPSRICLAGAVVLFSAASVSAQAAPDTDIHLAELTLGQGVVEIGEAYNATNRPGYDNQPWFTPDGSGFWYVGMNGEETDIFLFDLQGRTSTQITDTPWGEYSPSPSDGGEELYAIGGAGPDRMGLWSYSMSGEPLDGLTEPLPNAGYYGVANDTLMFLWINDEAGTLAHVDRRDGAITPFRDRVAPGPPKRIPGDDGLSIVEPNMIGVMWMMRVDPGTLEVTPLMPAVGDVWDYAWTPDGRVLMGDGEAIYVRDPRVDDDWTEVARFPGVGSITRMAVSPQGDRIAFVATRQ